MHFKYNEKETNPNPHINFISSLPNEPFERQEEARQLLRALAAQVRPVMKQHGFEVNSFEEYEYNTVFAGRNWNNGETVELVLRRSDGSFYPIYWLMSTLCHELAHIQHMSHGPAFQALWARLRVEVRQLQARGYYGDGFWSSGTRLRDLACIGGEGLKSGDFPEYVCGGAPSRTRPTATRRRRAPRGGKRRETVMPSLHTGAQTAKKRKAGSRVSSGYAFVGEGSTLCDSDDDGRGTGFGKRANSKRAREERAIAAENRFLVLQNKSQIIPPPSTFAPAPRESPERSDDDDDDDDKKVIIPETDTERRKVLLESERDGEAQKPLKAKDSWKAFKDEFDVEFQEGQSPPPPGASRSGSSKRPTSDEDKDVIEIFSDDDNNDRAIPCDVPIPSGSTFTVGGGGVLSKSQFKARVPSTPSTTSVRIGSGKMMQTQIGFSRKKEALGLTRVGAVEQTIGSKPSTQHASVLREDSMHVTRALEFWSCLVCTLENKSGELSCTVCGTLRGQRTWSEILS